MTKKIRLVIKSQTAKLAFDILGLGQVTGRASSATDKDVIEFTPPPFLPCKHALSSGPWSNARAPASSLNAVQGCFLTRIWVMTDRH